jgi:hypothetical protein
VKRFLIYRSLVRLLQHSTLFRIVCTAASCKIISARRGSGQCSRDGALAGTPMQASPSSWLTHSGILVEVAIAPSAPPAANGSFIVSKGAPLFVVPSAVLSWRYPRPS